MATPPIRSYMFNILDGSDDANTIAEALRTFSNNIYVWHTKEDFDHFLCGLKEERTIVLIVSGTIGVRLRTELLIGEKYARIDSIYIYCYNAGVHRRWSFEVYQVSTDRLRKTEY